MAANIIEMGLMNMSNTTDQQSESILPNSPQGDWKQQIASILQEVSQQPGGVDFSQLNQALKKGLGEQHVHFLVSLSNRSSASRGWSV